MRTAITASALALLAATNHVDAFASAPSMLRTPTVNVNVQQQVKFSSVRIFDKPVDKNEIELMMQPGFIDKEERKSTDPTPFFVSFFQNMTKDNAANLKMATAAMAFALMLLPLPSEAAMSGGRMGGSFSAPRSRSMSAPRSRSYGGGGGYSRGYTGGSYYSRPSVFAAPMISPFGFGGGYYGGPGALSYSRGPSFSSILLLGGFFFAVTSVMRGAGNMVESSFEGGGSSLLGSNTVSSLGPGTSVVQLSVAMEVPDRDDPNSILGALGRLSKTASTDSRVGIANLTSQVALEILRRRSSIVSASGNTKHFGDRTKAQREYQSRSIQERAKFENESVSKYGGVDYSSDNSSSGSASSFSSKATMAVVTLVLAIDGDSTKVPSINSMSDVEQALQRIASDAKVDDCLQSAEILWTPEDRTETLSLRDVVADYPELRSV
jgi:uncharacterized membrane protein